MRRAISEKPCSPRAHARARSLSQAKGAEKAAMGVQNKLNLQTAPIRTYLDSTVVPVLLQGLNLLLHCLHLLCQLQVRHLLQVQGLHPLSDLVTRGSESHALASPQGLDFG